MVYGKDPSSSREPDIIIIKSLFYQTSISPFNKRFFLFTYVGMVVPLETKGEDQSHWDWSSRWLRFSQYEA